MCPCLSRRDRAADLPLSGCVFPRMMKEGLLILIDLVGLACIATLVIVALSGVKYAKVLEIMLISSI